MALSMLKPDDSLIPRASGDAFSPRRATAHYRELQASSQQARADPDKNRCFS